jgi:hypothetical protein
MVRQDGHSGGGFDWPKVTKIGVFSGFRPLTAEPFK